MNKLKQNVLRSNKIILVSFPFIYVKWMCLWNWVTAQQKTNWTDANTTFQRLARLVKFSADDILKYFFLISSRKYAFTLHTNCLLRNVKTYFLEKNNKTIFNLSSAEYAQRVVKVQELSASKKCWITRTRLIFKYVENLTSKNWKFSDQTLWYFFRFCQNIDYGYSLEPSRRGEAILTSTTIYVFEQI